MGLRDGILIRKKKHIRIGYKFDCVEGVTLSTATKFRPKFGGGGQMNSTIKISAKKISVIQGFWRYKLYVSKKNETFEHAV